MERQEAIRIDTSPFIPQVIKLTSDTLQAGERLMSRPHTVETFHGVTLYHLKSEQIYFVLNEHSKLVYCMEYKFHSFGPAMGYTQVGVWRDRDWSFSRTEVGFSFAELVFWRKLMPKLESVISDKIQTAFGKDFWWSQMLRAFADSDCVYLLDLKGNNIKQVYRLKSIEELIQKKTEIWGLLLKDENTRLMISKHPLHFPPKVKVTNEQL